jgi:GntR family transcriptional regulator/MocR family aminotransferase
VDCLPNNAKLIYTTPSHQFPLGMPMSLARRLALLEWATTHGAAIIEDDYDSEFRFEGRPLESLQNLDRTGVVVYVGTFSKVIFPEIRLGFMVAPRSLQQALISAKQLSDKHSSSLSQARLAKFINDGYLAKHIRKMHKIYAQRRQCLLLGLSASLSDWLEPMPSVAGLHLTALTTPEISVKDLLTQAIQVGVVVSSLSPFYSSSSIAKSGLIFAYGLIEANQIDGGLLKLKELAISNIKTP